MKPTKQETKTMSTDGRRYWTSLESRAQEPEFLEELAREFPQGAAELELSGMDRRSFLGLMGASLALAGVSTGCTAVDLVRKPKQTILPYTKRPEDLVPGRPRYYASSALIGGSVLGLLVESQDGRPTKIEGNPEHPASRGGTNLWAQAEVLGLYDSERAKGPASGGADADWSALEGALGNLPEQIAAAGGAGWALLSGPRPSPTQRRLLAALQARAPRLAVYQHDGGWSRRKGYESVGAAGLRPVAKLDLARVIVSVDCDFLGTEGDVVANTRDFADGRRLKDPSGSVNRLYAVEPGFSVTGASADHRLRASTADCRAFLEALIAALMRRGSRVPPGAGPALRGLANADQDERFSKWVTALAADLLANRANSVVLVGERQDAAVHALGLVVNEMISAVGRTLVLVDEGLPAGAGSLADFAAAVGQGSVRNVVSLGVNAVYEAPADSGLAEAWSGLQTTVHHGLVRDETGSRSTWHVPASHFLESWGDWVSSDGTVSVQQPLIEPLYRSVSDVEMLAWLAGGTFRAGYDVVRETAASWGAVDFEGDWRRWLHDGVVDTAPAQQPSRPAFQFQALSAALAKPSASGTGIELNFLPDPKLLDGRYSANAWLQELPDPMTKVCWGNVAAMSPATARELGVGRDVDGARQNRIHKGRLVADVVRVELEGRSIELPGLVVPGLADNAVMLNLGYGREGVGAVAEGLGARAESLRTASAWNHGSGATVTKTGRREQVACTQDHWSLMEPSTGFVNLGRRERTELVRQTTLEEYRSHPEVIEEMDVVDSHHIKSLWKEPYSGATAQSHHDEGHGDEHGGHDEHAGEHAAASIGHPGNGITTPTAPWTQKPAAQQWGMAIDLNACTGCSACTVACQAENNIPVVGKERVLQGREMHWIRLDRYFHGDAEDPQAIVKPIPCMQCENAPCEQVCPVAATTHSPDGLNDMAYNRCIGTRYCANNCPYKVRRFNFFNFSKENHAANDLLAMQSNPDVTVRFRGVIEKCTYCVQRIRQAGIDAKVEGDGHVADGAIQTACQQACPAGAIVFGDVADESTEVSHWKAQRRNYGVLTELNTIPRTTFLARIRNPNPALA